MYQNKVIDVKSLESEKSTHLSGEENELVFQLVGRKCQTQCTVVAQLFQTEPPFHRHWIKKHTGALCFVKDNVKRSYFIRMYCLIAHTLIWEIEVYDEIEINRVKPYLLTFEGSEGMVALNFAFIDEAETFLYISTTTIERRRRRKGERMIKAPTNSLAVRNSKANPSPHYSSSPKSDKKDKKSKTKKKKLTRADISTPSNFQHVGHCGWKDGKFDFKGEDAALQPFLEKAGVTECQLKDKQTREFIYDFIQTNNVETIVKNHNPPPLPARNYGMTAKRSQPPLPPIPDEVFVKKSAPPPVPTNFRAPPARPPPVNNFPAPPPPPPPVEMPLAPPPMASNTVARPIPSFINPRDELLKSIQAGTKLKPASATERKIEVAPSDCDALANALNLALKKREDAIRCSSESEGEQTDEWSSGEEN